MEKRIEDMRKDMALQNLSPRTVKTYLYHIRKFTEYFKGNVEGLKEDDLRDLLVPCQDGTGIQRIGPGTTNEGQDCSSTS